MLAPFCDPTRTRGRSLPLVYTDSFTKSLKGRHTQRYLPMYLPLSPWGSAHHVHQNDVQHGTRHRRGVTWRHREAGEDPPRRWVGLGGGDADGSSVRNAVFLFSGRPLGAKRTSFEKQFSDGGLTGPPSIRALVATCRRLDSRARAPAGTNEQPWCVRYSGTARAPLPLAFSGS